MLRTQLWPFMLSVGMFVFPVTRRAKLTRNGPRLDSFSSEAISKYLRQRRKLLTLSRKLQLFSSSSHSIEEMRNMLIKLQRITVFLIDYLEQYPRIVDGDTDLNLLAALWNYIDSGWKQGREQAAEMYIMLLIHYPDSRFAASAKAWLITHRYGLP